jgi:hypothetical protein
MCKAVRSAGVIVLAAIRLAAVPPGAASGHHLKLQSLANPGAPVMGLGVQVRINGGALLELLLDSGAQTVVLDRATAARAGIAGGNEWDLVTPGSPAAVARETAADTIQVGDLTLRDVPVLVVDRHFGDGLHGVVPLALFREFLIRLDAAAKTLDLMPYPAALPDAVAGIPAISNHQLLFLRGTVNDRGGYFLLDTGASYNAVSRNLIREMNIPERFLPRVGLRGGGSEIDAPLIGGGLSVRFGAQEIAMLPLVAVDLSTASRYHGMEVAGLLGYPALRDSVLTVSYRDGLVRIEGRTARAQSRMMTRLELLPK